MKAISLTMRLRIAIAATDISLPLGLYETSIRFSQRLRFNRRGLVAMANTGKRNTNLSQ